MRPFAQIFDRYSPQVLLTVLILTGFLGFGMRHLQMARIVDPSTLPAGNELVRDMRAVQSSFGDDSRTVLVSFEAQAGERITSARNLALMREVVRGLEQVAAVKPETILSLTRIKIMRAENEDLLARPLIESDPKNQGEQAALETKISEDNLLYGRLISRDFKTAMVVASIHPGQDLGVIHAQVAEKLDPIRAKEKHTLIHVLGEPEINYILNRSMERDVVVFAFVSLVLMLLSLWLMFRSWQGVAFTAASLVVEIFWVMGLMGYYGEPFTLLSAMMPVAIVVMGSSNAIHIYFHLVREWKAELASTAVPLFEAVLVRTFRKVVSPLSMATLTAFIGTFTLLAFKIRPLQHFGLFCSLSALITFVVSLLLVPTLFRMVGHRSQHNGNSKPFLSLLEKSLRAIARFQTRNPQWIIGFCILVVILSSWWARNLNIGFDTLDYFPKSDPVREAAFRLDRTFEGTKSFEVMVDTREANGVTSPIFLEKLRAFEMRVLREQKGSVTRAQSLIALLERIHSLLNPTDSADLPQSRELAAQYLLLLGMNDSNTRLSSLVSSDYRKVKILFQVASGDTLGAEYLYRELRRIGAIQFGNSVDLSVGGDLVSRMALIRYLVWGKIQNVLLCILAIVLLLMVRYRSMTRGLITALPLPLGVIITFGVMGLSGIRLDFVTAIITSFAMGIGVDFSIHFLAALRRSYKARGNMIAAIEDAMVGPGKAIVYNGICCMVGFGVVIFSRFTVLNYFGYLMCINMAVVLVATLFLVPAVVQVSNPFFITGEYQLKTKASRQFLFAGKLAFCSLLLLFISYGVYYADAHSATLPQSGVPTADDLIRKSIKAIRNDHEQSTYVMKLVGRDGIEGVRKMNVWARSKGDSDLSLMIKFTEPANIRGTGFLNILAPGKEPNQWLYLPALNKTRRIAGGGSQESFLGSDFSLGDLSVDPNRKFQFQVTGSAPCLGAECFVLEGVPSSEFESAYSKKVLWIHKTSYLNVRSEFYNRANQVEKVMTLEGIRQGKDKRWIAERIEMANVQTGHKTTIEYEKRDLGSLPSDSVFSRSFLERP